MTPRQTAICSRFVIGLVLVELPVLTVALQQPTFDERLLAIGLLGGLAAAIEKYLTPQLSTPGAEVPKVS